MSIISSYSYYSYVEACNVSQVTVYLYMHAFPMCDTVYSWPWCQWSSGVTLPVSINRWQYKINHDERIYSGLIFLSSDFIPLYFHMYVLINATRRLLLIICVLLKLSCKQINWTRVYYHVCLLMWHKCSLYLRLVQTVHIQLIFSGYFSVNCVSDFRQRKK